MLIPDKRNDLDEATNGKTSPHMTQPKTKFADDDRPLAAGNDGVQEPVKDYESGALVGTARPYEHGRGSGSRAD